jgi:hypothetical protein
MVDEFGAKATSDSASKSEPHQPVAKAKLKALCVPARDEADEIVGTMLVQLLAARGIEAQVMSIKSLASEAVDKIREQSPDVVCISALPPGAVTHARYLAKRLRPPFPELKIIVGLWQESGNSKKVEERLRATGIDHFVTELSAAVEEIGKMNVLNLGKASSAD